MTLDQFFTKYNGKFIDHDKSWGYQCVDLVRQYIKEVLGWKPYDAIPPIQYAKYAFTNYNKKKFQAIANSPNNFPKEGDIVIWGWSWPVTGVAGHIAICSRADARYLLTIDQNYPTGSPVRFVQHYNRVFRHAYRGVLGWLRPLK